MAKPTPLSGFPEWLPGEQFVENTFVERVRRVFELHGFAPVETRAIEPLDQLLRKGETSKEVYTLRRLQAASEGEDKEQLGLHFDLTVPFARFVLENAGKLHFPLRTAVERRSGLVEQDDRGIAHERPCDGDPLPLPG